MYSQRIVLQNIEEYQRVFKKTLVYHSYAQIQAFSKHIDTLVNIESNSKSSYINLSHKISAARQKEIREWIQNEQALCALDAMYWAKNYAWVCDEQGQIFKFTPRKSQEIYNSVIAEFDEKQVSIELLILKGRQLGITTFTALLFLHRMLFVPHTQAIMASVKATASELISRIIDTAYNRCPWWLVPRRLPKRTFDNGSILSVQSGMQATGLAQGWTPTSIHLCLTPNTLIRIANGMLRPISMVTDNDLIITKEGEVAKVKAVALSPRRNELSKEIWLWGNFAPLGSTLDHPIFTNEGWKRADSIKCGDWVRHPVRRITRTIERFRGTHNPKTRVKEYQGKRFWVHLNPAWGYMCGLYLAEGSCRGMGRDEVVHDRTTGLIFSIHEKEIPEVSARLKEAFGKDQYLGVHIRKGSASAKVTVDVSHLAKWVMQNFGAKDNKRVPDWVWSAGREFCLQLVKGYLDGDGHYASGRNEIHASSIRVQLPIQMRDLIASLGFGWSCIQYKSAGVYYERNCKEQWTLIMNGECGKAFRDYFGIESIDSNEAFRWKYDILKENIDIEVESTADGFSKEFYDIEVDHPSHSFLTAQCAVHNSEIADIPDPVRTIEEGLFRAAHTSKNLFMVLEGTGRGNTGWLAETWRKSKEGYPKGRERLCPIFIPWVMCPEIYPKEDWLRKFPVENSWQPHEITRKHIAKCESYIRNTPYLAKVAGANWKMPIEQSWFWQFNYDSACKNHTQKTWASQMPADDFDSLTGVHDSVFDEEVLSEIEEQIYEVKTVRGVEVKERREPVQAYAIIGHDVDDLFYPDPDSVDPFKEKIKVEWKSFRGQEYEWTMLPLIHMPEDIEMNTMDRLLVYEPPQRGNYYAMGVDTADGLGTEDEDRTVLSVTNNRFNGESDVQCCEYTTNRLNSAQVVAFAACIGAWYGKGSPDGRGLKYAIEQIRGPGDTCQHQLKMMGFHNHHKPRRYDSKKIKENPGTKEGWYSNGWSVPMLMSRFQEAVNGGWYVPKSKWLIEELRTLERHETAGKSKMEHRSGGHDDRVRAAAVSYFTAHDFDILTERAQKRSAPPKKQEKPKGPGSANQMDVGSGW